MQICIYKGEAGVIHVIRDFPTLDFDFQYKYRPRKRGLSILLILRILSNRCQKSYHRDNCLVAPKHS